MGRRRAIALVIVSVWIGWTLFMWYAATRSFRAASEIWQKPQPEVARLLKPLGESASVELLHHFAAEVNAADFRAYGLAQILLGIALALLLWWQTPRDTAAFVITCVMLALVVILAAIIAPEIASVGRRVDFNASPKDMAHFWALHGAYTGLDGAKLLAAVFLAVRWILMA
ncbi:MAG: hypothetical protein ACRD3D_10430 [Terriglobia bacterium]